MQFLIIEIVYKYKQVRKIFVIVKMLLCHQLNQELVIQHAIQQETIKTR